MGGWTCLDVFKTSTGTTLSRWIEPVDRDLRVEREDQALEPVRWWDLTSGEEGRVIQIQGGLVSFLESGDLLPLPNPSDVATWSCLLNDLQKAVGWPPGPVGYLSHWKEDNCWVLIGRSERSHSFWVDSSGISEALVEIRTMLRQKGR